MIINPGKKTVRTWFENECTDTIIRSSLIGYIDKTFFLENAGFFFIDYLEITGQTDKGNLKVLDEHSSHISFFS